MASKLLNVLNEIEDGRQAMVRGFKNLGYIVTDNESIKDLADNVLELPRNNKFLGPVEILTPEEDPEIYKRPAVLSNILTLFRECTDITIEGKDFLPRAMVIFKPITDTNIFYMEGNNTYGNINDVSNSIKLGICGQGSTYDFTRIIIGNDNQQKVLDANTGQYNEIIYNWDESKDIIDPDTLQHYRYFFIYEPNLKNGYGGSYYNYTHLNVTELIFNNSGIMGNSMPNYCTYTDCVTLTTPNTPLSIAKLSSSAITIPPFTKTFLLKEFDNLQIANKEFNIANTGHPYLSYIDMQGKGTVNWTSFNNAQDGVAYLNVAGTTGLGQRVSSTMPAAHIKWLYVDPEWQQAHSVGTLYTPDLIDTNILENIKTASTANRGSYGCWLPGLNFKKIEYTNLETCTTTVKLYDGYCYEFSAPKLETVESADALKEICCTILNLPSLTTLPSTLQISRYTTRLLLPSLKDISKVDFWHNGQTYLEYVDVSGFENTSGTLEVSTYNSLEWVEVPNNVKININIYSISFEPACAIEIIKKMAPLINGETYTFKLNIDVYDKIPQEYLDLATSKGWIVTGV